MLAETPVVLFLKIPMTTTPALGRLTHLCMCSFTYTEFRLMVTDGYEKCSAVLYCTEIIPHIQYSTMHMYMAYAYQN